MKRSCMRSALTACLLSLSLAGHAEPEPGAQPKPDAAADQQRWAAFPVIASSPETGQMLGGMLFYFFPADGPGKQASTIDTMLFGTTKGQYALQISPNVFFDAGRYRLNAMVSRSLWQANYYGIGADSPDVADKYKSSLLQGSLTLERRFNETFVLDILGVFDKSRTTLQGGGLLETGRVPGSTDGTYNGMGVEGGYDTRDNTNSPTEGVVARYRYVNYTAGLGSDLAFSQQNWDFRYFRKTDVVRDSVLALAATVRRAYGDVPFRYLSSPDGTLILRGIENGRYRDNDMLALQSELRAPIHGRFSGTVFAEAAKVAPTLGDMGASRLIASVGVGFRYALNPSQRFNVRADVAWVDHGMNGIINVREAF
ncbi:MAG: BamA/TamA family outer membrane protein [Nitrosomonadales bacterium]|nr:BamA/TamA family outer membrane protein [Nitrosomonadales bacterium]